ncbi:hypothetical protein CPC08DRAFT_771404 [Agrocybe pediades]|nr:hypothetical protein CPC08DRAFT_771404 [Agrocybe pediades]
MTQQLPNASFHSNFSRVADCIILTLGTPFKSSKSFFDTPGSRKQAEQTLVPNVLHGLATPGVPLDWNQKSKSKPVSNEGNPGIQSGFTTYQFRNPPIDSGKELNWRSRPVSRPSGAWLAPSYRNQELSFGTPFNFHVSGGMTTMTMQVPPMTSEPPNREEYTPGRRSNKGGDGGGSSSSSKEGSNGHRRRRSRIPDSGRRNSRGQGGGPPGSPDDGGGGGPPGNGPSSFFSALPEQPLAAPYGNFIPTIKAELKQDQLPKWDGNHDTAVDYFWNIQQLAALGRHIPEALGYWLWKNLEEGSTVQIWFAMLAPTQQAYMHSHYLAYLRGIKEGYLGRVWQRNMNKAYESQSFRQSGHEKETPAHFVARRVMYTRMLVHSDEGGPLEVFLVMQCAPISWGPVINLDSIKSISDLYAKVTEHERALIHTSRMEHSHLVITDNLAYSLRKLGLSLPGSSSFDKSRAKRMNIVGRTAHAGQIEEEASPASEQNDSPDSGDAILKEVYQVLKQRQRPPPKGGYPFPKNDHVTTKMGCAPPSPCKVCGSANHWDKECPDWNTYLERRRRTGNFVSTSEEEETEAPYNSAYSILLSTRISELDAAHQSLTAPPADFHEAALVALKVASAFSVRVRKSVNFSDGDSVSNDCYPAESGGEALEERIAEKDSKESEEALEERIAEKDSKESEGILDEEIIKDPEKKSDPPPAVEARTISIQRNSSEGSILQLEAEAYIVPGMTVPILLGEDFQLMYEVCTTRSVSEGTSISFRGTPFTVEAKPVTKTEDFQKVKKNVLNVEKYGRVKQHQRDRNRRQKQRKSARKDPDVVRAAEDCVIKPEQCKRIRITGELQPGQVWFFERDFVANPKDNLLVIPNVLLDSDSPHLPVSNPSNRPLAIKKGEALGRLVDPSKYFDKVDSEASWEEFQARTAVYSAMVDATAGENVSGTKSGETSAEEGEPESNGPKTAEFPDPVIYPSDKLRELLDVGDLPDELQEEAWKMLETHVRAFGFDGRLGHYPGKQKGKSSMTK